MKTFIQSIITTWQKAHIAYNFFIKNLKEDVNEKRIKYWLREYFEDENIDYHAWALHHIGVRTGKSDIVMIVTLGRPGLLIGKGGKTIDEIRQRLSDWLGKPVKIKIIEYSIWQ